MVPGTAAEAVALHWAQGHPLDLCSVPAHGGHPEGQGNAKPSRQGAGTEGIITAASGHKGVVRAGTRLTACTVLSWK